MGQAINIAIVEYDENLRNNFQNFCKNSKKLNCTFAVDSTEKLVKYFSSKIKVDVAIVDLTLPGLDGFEAIKFIKRIAPKVEVIVLSILQTYEATFKAIKSGAIGYLVKSLTFNEIENNILNFKEKGILPLSPKIARRILQYFQPTVSQVKNREEYIKLTSKEVLVIKHITKGNSYKETALLLELTEDGVRYHMKKIYKKLKINSKVELMSLYVDGYFKKFFF